MGNCSAGCKKEFKKSNFNLTHEDPDRLVRAEWDNCTGCGMLYVMWRLLAATGVIIFFIYAYLVYLAYDSNWFVYGTTWALCMVMLDVVVQGLVTIVGYKKYQGQWGKTFPHMPWYLKISWLFNNIATCHTLTMSVGYWAFVAPIQIGGLKTHNILLHSVTSGYVIVNIFITATPVRIYHLYHTFLFNIVYLVFAAVYQLGFKQPYVPYTLDWDGSTAYIATTVATLFGLSAGVWLAYYALYRIRKGIYNCTDGTDRQQEATERIAYDRKHHSLGVSASVPVSGHHNSGGFSGGHGYSSNATSNARYNSDADPRMTTEPPKSLNPIGPNAVNTEPSFVVLSNMPRNPNE